MTHNLPPSLRLLPGGDMDSQAAPALTPVAGYRCEKTQHLSDERDAIAAENAEAASWAMLWAAVFGGFLAGMLCTAGLAYVVRAVLL